MTGLVTVTVLAVTADRHGDKTPTPVGTLTGCPWAPGPSSEDTDNRAQVIETGTLYPPKLTIAVTAQHRIRFPDNTVWEVDGEPQQWGNPFTGSRPGAVIHLKRVRG